MRYRAKVDRNQAEIVEALRKVGATVQPIHTIGKGCPDLLVAFQDVVYVMEVKDGSLAPSRRTLTPDEEKWHANWQAPVYIVNDVEDALWAIGVLPRVTEG